jgi:hypothetical protein
VARSKWLAGRIADDPLRDAPVGFELVVERVAFGSSDATPIPGGITNWTFFDGALIAIVAKDQRTTHVMGTGIMIAPGLAVTASHVVCHRLEEVLAGEVGLL